MNLRAHSSAMKLNMPNHSLSARGAGIFCALMFLLLRAPTVGARTEAPLSPQTVNRTVPNHTPPAAGWSLSWEPSTQDIRNVRLFVEPLVPTGAVPSAEENRQLAAALGRHVQRAVVDDFSDLEQFVANHPASPWTPSLTFNLGMEHYKTGWYSKALGAWERAWALLKDATDPAPKALGDRAAGELALMLGRIARTDQLSALLDSIKNRVIIGSAEQQISTARLDLWAMKNRPETAFRCGPVALDRVRASRNFESPAGLLVYNARATTNGHSLVQLARLSWDLGLNYRMAAREKGAALLMPAVVHMKLGHYAALLEEEDGRCLLQDPTFGNTWVSRRVLEEEGSGYFLVASGGELPGGWRPVSDAEGAAVWGKGPVSAQDTSATTPYDKCLPCWLSHLFSPVQAPPPGMAVATVSLMLVSLKLEDNPVGYQPPVGPPVRFVATFNLYESGQPANFSYSNLGKRWTFNWLAFITDNPSSPSSDVTYYTDGGGTLAFTYDTHARAFAPEVKSQTILTRTTQNSYVLLHPDGSQYIFSQPTATNGTSRNVFMTQVVDPRGNSVRISYDNQFRVIALTDAIGQVTVFSYTDAADPLKITQVTDPFGRFATFQYTAAAKGGLLAQITDCIGLTSQFSYLSTTSGALTTPYGTTSFEFGNNGNGGPNPWLVITDPDGEKERYEFRQGHDVGTPILLPDSLVPKGATNTNLYLDDRNTYYWDRNAYPSYLANTNNYTTARVYHWLHTGAGPVSSGVEESEQEPLESRVWFLYAGQPDPIHVGSSSQPTVTARVLEDGTTQLRTAAYNALGRLTHSVDPVGRSMTYVYSTNLVDLLEVRQTTGTNDDLIGRFLYNSQHLPTVAFDAAGQMTTNTYNARGQLLSTTDPKGETTTMTYDANGYLLSIVGPLGPAIDTVSFSYDAVGRVRSRTDTDGYTLSYGYDDLDRLTNTTFPDGTFEARSYTNLDLAQFQDRLGRQTTHTYNSLRQLVATQDPLGRVTRYTYCGCGSLSAMIDPLGRETTWEHDVQGRVTAQQGADGSRTTYNYEKTTSRLSSVVDEKGQLKVYQYYPDDKVESVSYPNAQNATPTVTYAYDPNYSRVVFMQDGIGTTARSYYPAGVLGALQPSAISGPWPGETVEYQYDALGRVINRAINGVSQTTAFDPLGRATNVVNALGSFGYDYDGATARVLDALYPNGQASRYAYFDNLGDRRLQQITHQKPNGSALSAFTYGYNAVGEITNWAQQLGAQNQTWSLGYDAADQLLSVAESGANAVNYGYGYDAAANRLFESTNRIQRTFTYNALNEILSASDTNAANATYQWDAEQRLAEIVQGKNQSQFLYDGSGHRVRIVETSGGVTNADRRFIWCGTDICEERDSNNIVVNRYFAQGEQQGGTSLFYARDHLGNVRELTDSSGAIGAEYGYAPYGAPAKLQGSLEANFGFTGHFRHLPSGLDLTLYRAYDAGNARWLSRDPLPVGVGTANLYAYVSNDPINYIDPLGNEKDPCEEFMREVKEALTVHELELIFERYHYPFPEDYVAVNHISKSAQLTADLLNAVLSAGGIDTGRIERIAQENPNLRSNTIPKGNIPQSSYWQDLKAFFNFIAQGPPRLPSK